jgi:ubiquinone/menaquinone biosynthesis C-methylase UbiE
MTDYLSQPIDLNHPDFPTAWDELTLWAARFGSLLLDHLDIAGGLRVLDLGCGSGFPLFELANLSGRSSQFVGLDLWAGALRRAAFKKRFYGLDYVHLVQADGARLPFQASSFDLIVSNLGVNNFADPAATFAACARVARPGGRFVLTTNLKGHMREFYAVYRETLIELGLSIYLERLAAHEDHRGTVESVSALVTGAGFRVARIVESAFTMRFADGGALLRHWLIRIGFLDGWRAVVNQQDEQSVFAALEARLNTLAQAEGGLALTVPMVYLEARR